MQNNPILRRYGEEEEFTKGVRVENKSSVQTSDRGSYQRLTLLMGEALRFMDAPAAEALPADS